MFCLWFAVWGLVNSFGEDCAGRHVALHWLIVRFVGVFQEYYQHRALPRSSPSSISWIGSLQVCLFIAGTTIIGPIFDIGYLSHLLTAGTTLLVFGLMMTSLCARYWQFMLAQGLCMGLGMSFLFVPCVAVVPPYFSSRRALAMGIGATGGSIGKSSFCETTKMCLMSRQAP